VTKKYKVIIDPLAKADLKEIFIFVSINDSVNSANKLLDTLESTCEKLEKYPNRGHIPPELRETGIKNYLEIHYKPYRIINEIEGKSVYIHSVLDGRRNIQEILNNRILR
jgi:toxin ParE1/3/4